MGQKDSQEKESLKVGSVHPATICKESPLPAGGPAVKVGTPEPDDTEYSSHMTDSLCFCSFLSRQSADCSASIDLETKYDVL